MTEIYVSPTGSDSAAGTAAAPFRTLNAGLAKALPGDEVVARAGTFAEALTMSRSGRPDAWITLRGEAGAKLLPPASQWNGITVVGNYVRVMGLTIVGARGDGIEANGAHHVEILGNDVSGSGESGIQTNGCDWITVEGNITHDNASTGWFSGI